MADMGPRSVAVNEAGRPWFVILQKLFETLLEVIAAIFLMDHSTENG